MKTVAEDSLPNLRKRIVVVTGGSSGIGKQVAADLLRRGDTVGILSQDPERLSVAEAELRTISHDIFAVVCDVTKQEDVDSAFRQVLERFGRIDVLVNNAGWATYRTFEESQLDELLSIINVNFIGVVRTSKAVLPSMIASRSGHIVNVVSVAGAFVITPNSAYSSSKTAVVALSEAMRYELRRFGINISVVYPGRTETSFFDHETFQQRIPTKETSITVPLEVVSSAIVRAIDDKVAKLFVPSYWGFFAWLYHAFPWFVRPLYARIIYNRIENIYTNYPTPHSSAVP